MQGLPIVRPAQRKRVKLTGSKTTIPSSLLSYRAGVFRARASSLRAHELHTTVKIASANTGKEVVFDLVEVRRDRAGNATEMTWRGKHQGQNLLLVIENDGVW